MFLVGMCIPPVMFSTTSACIDAVSWIRAFVPRHGGEMLADIIVYCTAALAFMVPVIVGMVQYAADRYGSIALSKVVLKDRRLWTLVFVLVGLVICATLLHSVDVTEKDKAIMEVPLWEGLVDAVIVGFVVAVLLTVDFLRHAMEFFSTEKLIDKLSADAARILH